MPVKPTEITTIRIFNRHSRFYAMCDQVKGFYVSGETEAAVIGRCPEALRQLRGSLDAHAEPAAEPWHAARLADNPELALMILNGRDMRVTDLILANNQYQQEARDSRIALRGAERELAGLRKILGAEIEAVNSRMAALEAANGGDQAQ